MSKNGNTTIPMSSTFTHWNPRFSPTAVQQGHLLLHMLLEPCVLLGCWFSTWELWGHWLIHTDGPPMELQTPSDPWVLSTGDPMRTTTLETRTQWLLSPQSWMSQHWRHKTQGSPPSLTPLPTRVSDPLYWDHVGRLKNLEYNIGGAWQK